MKLIELIQQFGPRVPGVALPAVVVPVRQRSAPYQPVVGRGHHRLYQGQLDLPQVRSGRATDPQLLRGSYYLPTTIQPIMKIQGLTHCRSNSSFFDIFE